VKTYCWKGLTKHKDKLPALSGIAKKFQACRKCRYFAGIWEDVLIEDLLWSCNVPFPGDQRRLSERFIAPSWSWARHFDTTIFWPLTLSYDPTGMEINNFIHLESLLCIDEIQCVAATSDPTGAVLPGAYIRLRGGLLTWFVDLEILPWPKDERKVYVRTTVNKREYRSVFYPDLLLPNLQELSSSHIAVYVLPLGLFIEPFHGAARLGAIVLRRSESRLSDHPLLETYERIGMIYEDQLGAWDEIPVEEKEIILL
jgi:hypothetical protein